MNKPSLVLLSAIQQLIPAWQESSTAANGTVTPAPDDILAWIINTYDARGNLTTTKQVRDFVYLDGPTTEYTYDTRGDLMPPKIARDGTKIPYTGIGLNPITVKRCGLQYGTFDIVNNRCTSATQTFDILGRPTQLATSKLYTQQRRYDANGRVICASDATNRWRDYSYTATGQPSGQSLTGVDATGNVALLDHSSTAFDALDRPVSRFDSAGYATQSEYDETGNVTAITNPDGYTIRFEGTIGQ